MTFRRFLRKMRREFERKDREIADLNSSLEDAGGQIDSAYQRIDQVMKEAASESHRQFQQMQEMERQYFDARDERDTCRIKNKQFLRELNRGW